mgnify:CR=1 FL=1
MRMPKRGLWALALLFLLPGAWAAPPTDEELEAEDRKELVTPAPPDFKPEGEERKLKLTLIARDSKIRKGENFWYRLEVQNVGPRAIPFKAKWSFFKVGYGEALNYRFLVTPPGGVELDPPIRFMLSMGRAYLDPFVPGGAKMSVAERAEAARKIADDIPRKEARGFGLLVNLSSGETLRTRSWEYLDQGRAYRRLRQGEDPFPATPGEFRELALASFKFDKVGTYRIRVEFAADPWLVAPDEEEIQEGIEFGLTREWQMEQYEERVQRSLGRFQSNIVEVEVVP